MFPHCGIRGPQVPCGVQGGAPHDLALRALFCASRIMWAPPTPAGGRCPPDPRNASHFMDSACFPIAGSGGLRPLAGRGAEPCICHLYIRINRFHAILRNSLFSRFAIDVGSAFMSGYRGHSHCGVKGPQAPCGARGGAPHPLFMHKDQLVSCYFAEFFVFALRD